MEGRRSLEITSPCSPRKEDAFHNQTQSLNTEENKGQAKRTFAYSPVSLHKTSQSLSPKYKPHEEKSHSALAIMYILVQGVPLKPLT